MMLEKRKREREKRPLKAMNKRAFTKAGMEKRPACVPSHLATEAPPFACTETLKPWCLQCRAQANKHHLYTVLTGTKHRFKHQMHMHNMSWTDAAKRSQLTLTYMSDLEQSVAWFRP